MAWFAAADASTEMDTQIEAATSEAIPNGDLDMAVALEITDVIRSKKVPPKTAMRCLKKRLAKVYTNPNLLQSALKLTDMCVKNGGAAFIEELNSKEFVDYLVEFIFKVHYDPKKPPVYSNEAKYAVGVQILKLVREWSLYVENQYRNSYLQRVVEGMQRQGYEFPAVDEAVARNAAHFVESVTPPDWVDGKECMICYNPFSVINRKHHCRACGGVFCQDHSSRSLALPSLGIAQAVRVCDDCYQIHKGARDDLGPGPRDDMGLRDDLGQAPRGAQAASSEDEDFKRAIEMSLRESGPMASPAGSNPAPVQTSVPAEAAGDSDMDEDMKAAIAASLADVPASQPGQVRPPPANPEPESEFYQTAIPFDTTAYMDSQGGGFDGNQASSPSGLQYGSNGPQGGSSGPHHSQSGPSVQNTQHPSSGYQDLTQQEEDDINLFVQLINGVKNDRHRQANILNDQNLAELHSRVVRLRPRLNRSLRDSLEKYDFFLELNNKINTVTRLYDQFLESKLSQAYGRQAVQDDYYYNENGSDTQAQLHRNQFSVGPENPQAVCLATQNSGAVFPPPPEISLQPTGPSYNHTGASYNHTGASYNHTGASYNHTGASYNHTGASYNATGASYNATGPSYNATGASYNATGPSYNATGASYNATGPSTGPSYNTTGPSYNHTGPVNHTGSVNHTGPAVHARPPNHQSPVATGQSAPYPLEAESARFKDPSTTQLPSPSKPGAASFNHPQLQQSVFPQVPSSPPGSDVSDAESVASRFPALGDEFEEDVEPETPHHGHASERYPTVTQIEKESAPNPRVETPVVAGRIEAKPVRSEPEPLIEL